jgi:hypothetical protein
MPGSSIVGSDEVFSDLDQPVAETGYRASPHTRRERVLLWCIGTIFGLAMLLLLIAMIAAEMSLHRRSAELNDHPVSAPTNYSVIAARQ